MWLWRTTYASAAVLLALASGEARAGACCVGSTAATPAILGECERWAVGFGLGGATHLARWDAQGQITADSLDERALISSVAAGWRWSRDGQITAELPGRLTWRATDAMAESGGGVGDARVTAILDPIEETSALGAPVLRIGARLPSGRSWEESEAPLQSDVTGLVGPAVTAGLAMNRTLGRVPWSLGVSGELPVGVEGAPALVAAAGSVGRYFGTDWTVTASLRHERTAAVWQQQSYRAARTTAGARIIRGQRLAWRAWAGAGVDLPVSGLGLESPAQATATGGVVLVR